MKRSLLFLSTTFLILLSYSSVYPWDTETAHRHIVYDALNYLQLKNVLSGPQCSDILSDLYKGAVDEDFPSWRCFFHFHGDGNYYPIELNSQYAWATCDSLAWGFGNAPSCTSCVLGITKTLTNEFTWNALQDPGRTDKWVILGHIVHLLADLAVPDHTRNDDHAIGWSLEDYAITRILKDDIPPLPSDDFLHYAHPELFLTNLSNYTRANFFSKDTVFDPLSPQPMIANQDANYFYDPSGLRIAHKSASYRLTRSLQDADLDDFVFDDQFRALYPKAVLYSASLIKYYHDIYGSPAPGPWLSFVEGNPSIPGDGFTISSLGGENFGYFELIPPFSLAGITDGLTMTVFFPSTTVNFTNLSVVFKDLRRGPNECIAVVGLMSLPEPIIINSTQGWLTNVPQWELDLYLYLLNNPYPGFGVTCPGGVMMEDVAISSFALNGSNGIVMSLDAAAILPGQNAVP